MFRAFRKRTRILFFVFFFIAFYLLITALFGMSDIIQQRTFRAFLSCLPFLFPIKVGVATSCALLLVFAGHTLDISANTVGDGQHGKARWATDSERKKAYETVPMGHETKPGLVTGFEHGRWLIDTSDGTAMLVAPPGAGKTKSVYIPTVEYNARVNRNTNGKGASFILTDSKGELLRSCGNTLEQAGYRVLFLDFRNPLRSYRFNLMHSVNVAIDTYKAAEAEQDKVLHYAEAERNAKIIAGSIVENLETSSRDDTSQYFTETSKGLITGLILLVSEYGAENERHIISVFRLIIELNGLNEGSTQDLQRNKLEELLEYVDNERIVNFVGPAMKADNRTSMNIFSSALGKLVSFIDAELEQLVCGHSLEFDAKEFIEKPTAIFLICPDENTTRHFFASLFIRNLLNELIGYAEKKGGLLPRPAFNFWDEWGNMPPVKDVDSLFTAGRSRGIRSLVALQSFSQMELRYGRVKSQIIKDSCQILIFTFVSPAATNTAEELSKSLGYQTVQSGSISRNEKGGSSATFNMVRKPLLSPDEITHMPWGHFVISKAGTSPIQTKLPICFSYLPDFAPYDPQQDVNPMIAIQYLTGDKIRRQTEYADHKVSAGMFD